MAKWNYGGAFKDFPIDYGQKAMFSNGSIVQAHNIFEPLPEFMKKADLIFSDPPWNLGNLNSFYTKAGRNDYQSGFESFYKRLFECIKEINPRTCYIEIGKEYIAEFIIEMKKQFHSVTFFNSSYYHKADNHCYIIKGSQKYKKLLLDNIDEENIIDWICQNENYSCIGDLCIGRGLVACGAQRNGKQFVGTEINPKRLSVLLKKISKIGGVYNIN